MKVKAEKITLMVGTSKGAFLFTSDPKRKNWKGSGPFFSTMEQG